MPHPSPRFLIAVALLAVAAAVDTVSAATPRTYTTNRPMIYDGGGKPDKKGSITVTASKYTVFVGETDTFIATLTAPNDHQGQPKSVDQIAISYALTPGLPTLNATTGADDNPSGVAKRD